MPMKRLMKLIDKLDLDNGHLFKIGHKEFEDSFQAETIYRCWKEYVESENKNIGLLEVKKI